MWVRKQVHPKYELDLQILTASEGHIHMLSVVRLPLIFKEVMLIRLDVSKRIIKII